VGTGVRAARAFVDDEAVEGAARSEVSSAPGADRPANAVGG